MLIWEEDVYMCRPNSFDLTLTLTPSYYSTSTSYDRLLLLQGFRIPVSHSSAWFPQYMNPSVTHTLPACLNSKPDSPPMFFRSISLFLTCLSRLCPGRPLCFLPHLVSVYSLLSLPAFPASDIFPLFI